MKYALKTADNLGLYLDKFSQPTFVEDPAVPAEFWPVNSTVADGFRATGFWQLVSGVCVPRTVAIPAPTQAENDARIWQEKLAGTLTDPVTGIKFDASIYSRDLLTGHMTLMQAALSAGLVTSSTAQSVWDSDNVEHAMTVGEAVAHILRFGLAWQAMYIAFAP